MLEPGSTDPEGVTNPTLSNDPDFQWMLSSALQLPRGWLLDFGVRHVDRLPHPDVPRYTAVEGRVAWRHGPRLELALRVLNMFDSAHAEFGAAPNRSVLPRMALLTMDWRFAP